MDLFVKYSLKVKGKFAFLKYFCLINSPKVAHYMSVSQNYPCQQNFIWKYFRTFFFRHSFYHHKTETAICPSHNETRGIVREPAILLIKWLRPKSLKVCSYVEKYAEFKNQTLKKIGWYTKKLCAAEYPEGRQFLKLALKWGTLYHRI